MIAQNLAHHRILAEPGEGEGGRGECYRATDTGDAMVQLDYNPSRAYPAPASRGSLLDVGHVTLLLRELRDGDRDAFDQLVPLVYDELRRLARSQLRRSPPGRTLDTTGLVHEAYLKMANQQGLDLQDRHHFLAVSAHAMRQVLVDFARARLAAKRGGGAVRVTLKEDSAILDAEAERLCDVDRALEGLRAKNQRMAKVVECRYFAGLSEQETADALGISLRTAQREWMRARAWLREALGGEG